MTNILSIKFEQAEKQESAEVTHRDIYFFECKICHKNRRQSLKESRAGEGVCKKCRHNRPNPNQFQLFDNPRVYTPDTQKCPQCGENMEPIWQNNGWNGDDGPRKDEITGYKCPNCGHQE